MEKQTQLYVNNLANRYVITDDDAVFSSLYKTIASDIGLKLRNWETTTYLAESHDITDLFHDALMNSLDKLRSDGHGDFVKIFFRSLHNNYKSLLRKLGTRRKHEALFSFTQEEKDGETTNALEVEDDVNIELDLIKRDQIKTDADKRQLINVLTVNSDSITTAIVNEFLNSAECERLTPTAIGKKLGIHHEKVKRVLRKLAKRYDERQFGEIETYWAV